MTRTAPCGFSRIVFLSHVIDADLCGLDQMPPAGGWIVIGGLRIRAGSGSPATVFGLIP